MCEVIMQLPHFISDSPIFAVILATIVEDYVRAAIVIILTIAVSYQFVFQQVVNQELLSLYTLVLGYYFGRGVANYTKVTRR